MGFFERFLSRRYLFNRRQKWLVSVITFISLAGVTVGVAALIIVLGVIEGFDRDIFGKIIDIYPHVRITEADSRRVSDPEPILAFLRSRPEIELAVPVLSRQALLEHGQGRQARHVPAQLIGVASLGPGELYNIPAASDGSTIRLGDRDLLLGLPLAYRLEAGGGQTVSAITGVLALAGGSRHPRVRRLNVIGTFTTGHYEFDELTGFVSPETARQVFGSAEAADYIHVRSRRPFAVRRLKAELVEALGPTYRVTTWEEENGEFFQALKLEKLGLWVILLLVVVVASFNIAGTLILMVMEKGPEIGILKALGASEGMIRATFLQSGLTIGALGTSSGLLLGLAGCWFVRHGLRLGPPGNPYGLSHLPVVIEPATVGLIVAASLGISLLAAFFPAAQAARLDPVEALRRE